jgi:hypothetical protein
MTGGEPQKWQMGGGSGQEAESHKGDRGVKVGGQEVEVTDGRGVEVDVKSVTVCPKDPYSSVMTMSVRGNYSWTYVEPVFTEPSYGYHVLIGCYCSVHYHMLTDISHPRIVVLGFLDIIRFKLHFKVSA